MWKGPGGKKRKGGKKGEGKTETETETDRQTHTHTHGSKISHPEAYLALHT